MDQKLANGQSGLNVLARLKQNPVPYTVVDVPLVLKVEPEANTRRYDYLREVGHVR